MLHIIDRHFYGNRGLLHRLSFRSGMTVVELMVTLLIITIFSAALGVYFVKLLNIREQEREEAYVREKLVEICGAYADYLSIASSISNNLTATSFVATYPRETGGLSLETGRVTRITHLNTALNSSDHTIDLNIGHYDNADFVSGFSRNLNGDAMLFSQTNSLVAINGASMVTPLDATRIEDAHLVYLHVTAWCKCMSDKGEEKHRYVTAGRIVRLWNKK